MRLLPCRKSCAGSGGRQAWAMPAHRGSGRARAVDSGRGWCGAQAGRCGQWCGGAAPGWELAQGLPCWQGASAERSPSGRRCFAAVARRPAGHRRHRTVRCGAVAGLQWPALATATATACRAGAAAFRASAGPGAVAARNSTAVPAATALAATAMPLPRGISPRGRRAPRCRHSRA